MHKLVCFTAAAFVVSSSVACGQLKGGNHGWGEYRAYEFIFQGGEPYAFSDPDQNDEAPKQTARDLLTDRVFDLYPPISVLISPDYSDNTQIQSYSVSSSPIHGWPGWSMPTSELGLRSYYHGYVDYVAGQMLFYLDQDMPGSFSDIRIRTSCSRTGAQQLVDSIKDICVDGYRSPGSIEMEVTLLGNTDGREWELSCRQALTVVTSCIDVI